MEPRFAETSMSMPPVTPTEATVTGSALSSVPSPLYHWVAWRAAWTSTAATLYVPGPRPSVRQVPLASVETAVTRSPVAASWITTTVATTGWRVSRSLTVPVSAPPVGSRTTLFGKLKFVPAVTLTKDPSSSVGPPAGTPILKNFVTNPGADTRIL